MTATMSRSSGNGPNMARPYTLTQGRTRPRIDLPLEAAIETLDDTPRLDWNAGDIRSEVVTMCLERPSIAEIAALLDQPLGVVRVIVGDLVASNHLRVHATLGGSSDSERRGLIERTLSGLRAL